MQLLIRDRALVARLPFPKDGGLVAPASFQMSVETIFRNIQFPPNEPFREWRAPGKNFCPGRLPFQLARFFRPELRRIRDLFAIQLLILGQTLDLSFLGKCFRRLENARFDQVRFDV